jgi:ribosome-associated protein
MLRLARFRPEFRFTAIRSRGAGGQNVNKVSSAALLKWNIFASSALSLEERELILSKLAARINSEGELYIKSDEFRDLEKNKKRCLEKLEELLEKAFYKAPLRKATKATRASKERKLEKKSHKGQIKKLRRKVDW